LQDLALAIVAGGLGIADDAETEELARLHRP
jgi:hypothetical protein